MSLYTVTYCVLDHQFEGNLFWHSCLLLSECDDSGHMKVVDNWGFYGLPSTTRDSLLSQLKIRIGLDVDFDNHGMLRHEDLRYLETGFGLHGVTFELTKVKFDELQNKCKKMAADQDAAINEAIQALKPEVVPSAKPRIYPYEKLSREIYQQEKESAQQKNSEPRLKAFEVKPTFTLLGASLAESRTCKSQTIEFLDGILTSQQIGRLTENGVHPTVPRYSGVMEKMYLHSSGPLRQHTKKSGEIVNYRVSSDPGVELHWTLPPQEVEVLSEDTKKLLLISKRYVDDVKNAISQLQRIEWLFINAVLPAKFQSYRQDLIERIRDIYTRFSSKNPNNADRGVSGWRKPILTLFSSLSDQHEQVLQQNLMMATRLTDRLYFAMKDGLTICDQCPPETDQAPAFGREPYYNPLEALASYLSTENQKKLCSILNRSYFEVRIDRTFMGR